MSEAPLLQSDVLSPKTFEAKKEKLGAVVQDSGIPILSWSRGSPFDPAKALLPKSHGKISIDISSPSNMENYFYSEQEKEGNEDREEGDEGDDDEESTTAKLAQPHKLDYGTNDSIFEESPTTKSEVSFTLKEANMLQEAVADDHDDSGVIEEDSAVVFGRNSAGDDQDDDDESEDDEVDEEVRAESLEHSLYSTNFPENESIADEAKDAGGDGKKDDEDNEDDDDYMDEGRDLSQSQSDNEEYNMDHLDRLSQDSLGSGSIANDETVSALNGEEDDDDDDEEEEASGGAVEGTLASYLGLLQSQGDAVNVLNEEKLDQYAGEILRSAKKDGRGQTAGFDLDSIMRDYDAVMSAGKKSGTGLPDDDEEEDILSMGRQESRNMIQTMMADVARIKSNAHQEGAGQGAGQRKKGSGEKGITKKGAAAKGTKKGRGS